MFQNSLDFCDWKKKLCGIKIYSKCKYPNAALEFSFVRYAVLMVLSMAGQGMAVSHVDHAHRM